MTVEIRDGWLHGTLADDTGREWPLERFPQPSARGPLAPGTPQLILHTTETWPTYVGWLGYPSQWQCGEGMIGQHIRLGLAGDAVNEWDRYAQQIEMVADSRLERWLPAESTLGPTVALVAWLHRTGRIRSGLKRPTANWPVVLDGSYQASTTYYRRDQGFWPNADGVYGHVEIPANKHWDPGSFDYPRFFARVQTAIEVQEDDVLTPEQQDKLNRVFNMLEEAAKELGLEGPNGRAVGARLGRAAREVEEGIAPTEGLKRGDTVTLA